MRCIPWEGLKHPFTAQGTWAHSFCCLHNGPLHLGGEEYTGSPVSPLSQFYHILSHLQLANSYHFTWKVDVVILKLHSSANLLFTGKHFAALSWIYLKCSDIIIEGQELYLYIHTPSLPRHIYIYSTWISQNALEVIRSKWYCYDNGQKRDFT